MIFVILKVTHETQSKASTKCYLRIWPRPASSGGSGRTWQSLLVAPFPTPRSTDHARTGHTDAKRCTPDWRTSAHAARLAGIHAQLVPSSSPTPPRRTARLQCAAEADRCATWRTRCHECACQTAGRR